jgi:hypothetical protein
VRIRQVCKGTALATAYQRRPWERDPGAAPNPMTQACMVVDLHRVKGYDVHRRTSRINVRRQPHAVLQTILVLRARTKCLLEIRLTIATNVICLRTVVQVSVTIDPVLRVVTAMMDRVETMRITVDLTNGITEAAGITRIYDLIRQKVIPEASLGNRLLTRAMSSVDQDQGTASKGKQTPHQRRSDFLHRQPHPRRIEETRVPDHPKGLEKGYIPRSAPLVSRHGLVADRKTGIL